MTYRHAISLRLRHPSADLGYAADALGLSPSNRWHAGEPRTSPTGARLEGINRESFWTSRMVDGGSAGGGLAAAIADVLDRLAPASDVLKTFADTGGRCELFIGWFIHGGNGGDLFGHELLRRLADLRIDLSFDVYGNAGSLPDARCDEDPTA